MPTTPLRCRSKIPARGTSWSPDYSPRLDGSFTSLCGGVDQLQELQDLEKANEQLSLLIDKKEAHHASIDRYLSEGLEERMSIFLDSVKGLMCGAEAPPRSLLCMKRALEETLAEEQVRTGEMEVALDEMRLQNNALEAKHRTSRSYFVELRAVNDEMWAQLDVARYKLRPSQEELVKRNTCLLADRARLLGALEEASTQADGHSLVDEPVDMLYEQQSQVEGLHKNCQLLRTDNERLRTKLDKHAEHTLTSCAEALHAGALRQMAGACYNKWKHFTLLKHTGRVNTNHAVAQTDSGHDAEAEGAMHELQEEVSGLETRLGSKLRECLQLQERLKAELLTKETILNDACQLCQQRDTSVAAVKTLAQELQTLTQSNTQLVSENDMLSGKLSAVLTDYASLQDEMAALTSRLDTVQGENTSLTSKLAEHMQAARAPLSPAPQGDDLEVLKHVLSQSRASLTTAHMVLEATGLETDPQTLRTLKQTVESHMQYLTEQNKAAELERTVAALVFEEQQARAQVMGSHKEKWNTLEMEKVSSIISNLQRQLLSSATSYEATTARMQTLNEENSALTAAVAELQAASDAQIREVSQHAALVDDLKRKKQLTLLEHTNEVTILKSIMTSLETDNKRLAGTLKENMRSLDATLENMEQDKKANAELCTVLKETLSTAEELCEEGGSPLRLCLSEEDVECTSLAAQLKNKLAALKEMHFTAAEGKQQVAAACSLLKESINRAGSLSGDTGTPSHDEGQVLTLESNVCTSDLLTRSANLLSSLQATSLTARKELADTREQLGASDSTVQELTKARNEYVMMCNNLQVAHDTTCAALHDATEERDNTRAQLATLKAQLALQEMDLNEAAGVREKLADLTSEAASAAAERDALAADLKKTQDALTMKAAADDELSSLRATAAEQATALSASLAKCADIGQQHDTLNQESAAKLTQLEAELCNKDSRIAELEERLANTEVQLRSVQEEFRAVGDEKATAVSANEALQRANAQLTGELELAESEASVLREQVADISTEKEEAAAEAQVTVAELSAQCERAKANAESHVQDLALEQEELLTRINSLVYEAGKQKDLLESQLAAFAEKAATAAAECADAQAALQHNVCEAREALAAKDEHIAELKAKLAETEEQLHAVHEEGVQMEARLQASAAVHAELSAEKESAASLTDRVAMLEEAAEAAKTDAEVRVQESVCEQEKLLSQLSILASEAEERKGTLESQLALCEEKAATAAAEYTEAKVALEAVQGQLMTANETAGQLGVENQHVQQELAEQLASGDRLRVQLAEAAADLLARGTRINELEAQIAGTAQQLHIVTVEATQLQARTKEIGDSRDCLISERDVLTEKLQSAATMFAAEATALRGQVEAISGEKEAAAGEALRVSTELAKKVDDTQASFDEARETLAAKGEHIAELSAKQAEAEEQLRTVREEGVGMEARLQASAEAVTELQREHAEATHAKDAAASEARVAAANLTDRVAMLEGAKTVAEAAKAAAEERVRVLVSEQEKLLSQIGVLVGEAEAQKEALVDEIRTLKSEATRCRATCVEKEEEVRVLCERIKQLTTKKMDLDLRIEHFEEDKAALQGELRDVNASLAKMSTENETMSASNATRQAEMEHEIAALQSAFETEKEAKVRMRSDHYSEINRISACISEEVEEERKREREIRIRLEVDALKAKNEKRELEIRMEHGDKKLSTSEYKRLVQQVEGLSSELSALQKEKEKMVAHLDDSNLAAGRLQHYVETLEQRDMESTLEVNHLKDKVGELQEQLQAPGRTKDVYGQKELLEEFQAEKEALLASKKEVQARNKEYKKKVDTLEQTASSLIAKNRELTISQDHMRGEEGRLRKRVDDLTGILSIVRSGHDTALSSLNDSDADLSLLKEELLSARNKIITLTSKPPSLANERLASDVAALSRCNNLLQTEVCILNKQLATSPR